MQKSESAKCEIFDRVNGSASNKLEHPTSSNFDLSAWNAVITEDTELKDRDLSLISAALIIGLNQQKLRVSYLPHLFKGLNRAQIATFAIADANRAWSIVREKGQEARGRHATDTEAVYSAVSGQLPIDAGPSATPGGADALNMTIVDCVPHWLFLASSASDVAPIENFEYDKAGRAAQMLISLEHAFKEVWQQVLWEPWTFGQEDDSLWVAKPVVPADRALWAVWSWRDENLMFQHQLAHFHFSGVKFTASSHALAKTAASLSGRGTTLEVKVAEPTEDQHHSHEGAMITIESSYLGELLDEQISKSYPSITLRLLARAVAVLQDLAALLLPPDADVDYVSEEDIDRIACGVPRTQILFLLSSSLQLSSSQAEIVLSRLVSEPFKDMSAVFRNGLWHRPLISFEGSELVYLLTGALVWGSPVRRLERWLQDGVASKTDDLSKTPLGLRYEALVRDKLRQSIDANPLLAGVSTSVVSIPKGQAKEEVDGLFRIGSTVFVLEVKCFLSPSEPRERYDYLRKLEKAAKQASRKAAWLRTSPAETEKRLGTLPTNIVLNYVPLVVVNQSTGSGCRFDDCTVIDAHFLSLYLHSGSYRSGGAVDFTKDNQFSFVHQAVYATAEDAERKMIDVFTDHPGLKSYLASVAWTTVDIPAFIQRGIQIWTPIMDATAYVQALPIPAEVLSSK